MARGADQIPDSLLRLALATGVGPVTFRRLLDRLDSAEEIINAPPSALQTIEGIGPERADAIRRQLNEVDCDDERDRMREAGVEMIFQGDPDYPALLASIPDPPVALWMRGALRPEDQAAIAIVGSRRCTAYGREQTGRFASLLAQCGLTVVSGGARGIDGEAHRAALRVDGRTIVVCGCGLSHNYPEEHAELFDRVADGHGAVISEYPMPLQPRAEHFPRRNRIISGLSLGVLVIEAGRGSGALITAKTATEVHGREVMALPGRVDSPASAGCLRAIRDGWAAMVLSHDDVLLQLESASHLLRGAFESIATSTPSKSTRAEPSLFEIALSEDQRRIVDHLRSEGAPVLPDQLAAATQLPMQQIMADLTILQIRNIVARDGRGVRLSRRAAAESEMHEADATS